jgi:hypothetical protein
MPAHLGLQRHRNAGGGQGTEDPAGEDQPLAVAQTALADACYPTRTRIRPLTPREYG